MNLKWKKILINKVLSSLSELVPKNEWDALEFVCIQKDEIKYKGLLKGNAFSRYYSELNNRNQIEAKQYLKKLKNGILL